MLGGRNRLFVYDKFSSVGTEKHSSQSKALLLYTFAAFGGSEWGQMALGYRYTSFLKTRRKVVHKNVS